MPSNRFTIGLLALLPAMTTHAYAAGDLMTLFTTSQERQLINTNRYRIEEVRSQPVQVVEEPEQSPVQIQLKQEIQAEYMISGITLSGEGRHTVWINSAAYDDGAQLDDNSRIKVVEDDGVKVRITTPDGKHYFGSSGDTLEVTYMATINN